MNYKSFALSLILSILASGSFAQQQEPKVYTIEELFTLAEENSQQLQVSRAGIEIADQRREVAKTQKRPSLSANLTGSYIGNARILDTKLNEVASVDMPHFGNSFAVQASQVIFKGGAINKGIEAAALNQQVAQLTFEKNRADIKLLLVGRYADMYRLLNQRETYERNIDLAKLRLQNIQNLYKEGMLTRNDVIRSELQITNLNMALQEVNNNLTIANQQLGQIVGVPASTFIVPDSSFIQTLPQVQNYDTYLAQALNDFPDIKAGQVNTEIAQKNLEIAKADRLPTISLQAGNSTIRPITSSNPVMDMYSQGWNAGVGINFNISSLYNAKHTIGVAKAQEVQQQELLTLQRQNLENEVNSAFIKHNEARERSKSFEHGVRLANENYRIVEKKYLANLALLADMLDATNAKLDAELQKANADANIIYTYYQLERLAGNL
ncbi:TolC family protein [Pontibacter sp. E15-1]|uniref:TolC family protein n=1 Tax=Pontibacter sp. E15-1 TaxID=2919918 RepID=UPI001F4FB01F|nr:TolC family protein [Pontibacter sp. E15-1]MCJ8165988.1 TolC family protein [Pontibacter sp. E15-1]